ncbi:MAG: peptide transporter substrate-binding protein [Bacilli bacterium]|nr:peptide transporter substrate-binding protein [Bacilli bacterium]
MILKNVMTTGLIVTIVGAALVGCNSNSSKSVGSSAGQVLTMDYRAEPPALDVSIAESAAAFTFLGAISEGLYRLDKDMKPQPALAKELPKISADGLTYTITLRDGITWADGTAVKAQDFVYSFQRTLDPATKASYAFMVGWIKGGDAITTAKTLEEVEKAKQALGAVAKDEKTLVITLERPVAYFTSQLAFESFFPQKEEFVKAQGDKGGADADKVLGAGPFKLTKWDHGQTLVLEKNDKYWDAKNVNLTKVTVNIVKDVTQGLNLYETDATDYADINGEQMKQYEGKPDKVIKNELVTGYLNFQQTKVPAFKNLKIRQAFSSAIDRKGLADTVLLNGSVPSTGYVPTKTFDGNGKEFRAEAKDTEIAFDAAKAKTLLADGLKEAGLTEMPKLSIIGDDQGTGRKLLEFLVSQWKTNLGVEVTAEPIPHKNRLDRELKKDFSIVSTLWGADYNDPMTYLDMYVTGGPFNLQDWSNKSYDDLVKAAQIESDTAKRSKMLVDAEKILMDESAIFPLYFRSSPFLVKPKVQGLILPPYGIDFELKWTSIKH